MVHRRRALSFSLLLLSAVIAAQQPGTSSSGKQSSPIVTITDEDNGKSVEVPDGGTLLVKLKSNPSTGYTWAVKGDASSLRLIKSTYRKVSHAAPVAGASGFQELQFAAMSAGLAQLTLEYRRPWERNQPPAKTFSVQIRAR